MSITERQERPTTTLTSWYTTFGILKLMTDNNRRRSNFVQTHRELLHNFYDAWFDIAVGKGGEKLSILISQYAEKESPTYNPKLLHQLGPYFSIIITRFPEVELGE